MAKQRRGPFKLRDTALVMLGMAMLVYETVAGTDRPYLIGAAVALCFGLPLTFLADVKRRTSGNGGQS